MHNVVIGISVGDSASTFLILILLEVVGVFERWWASDPDARDQRDN